MADSSNASYQKFVKDVEFDVRKTVDENLKILGMMKGAATDDDYRVDWVAPSIRMSSNVVNLFGDLVGHWRTYAVNAAPNLISEEEGW